MLLYNKCPLSLFTMSPAVTITFHDLSRCLQASVRTNSLYALCPGPGEQRAITSIETDRKRERERERERGRRKRQIEKQRDTERASAAVLNIVFLLFYLSSVWFFLVNIKLFVLCCAVGSSVVRVWTRITI